MSGRSCEEKEKVKSEHGNPPSRGFVAHRAGDYRADITRIEGMASAQEGYPVLSVIIPTADGFREGHFPRLLKQLKEQSFQKFETIIVKGDPRQGRAINAGADLALGRYLLTLDDDTRLGQRELFEVLVHTLDHHLDIGMAGVPNLVPDDAPRLVKRAMEEIPRRTSPMVARIIDSDLAEHPCLIMRKQLFYSVGGENELIPRGLDPYLRYQFRATGHRVVVVPGVWVHHLPPSRLSRLLRQFFRNGKCAAYCNKFYPGWVYEQTTTHTTPEQVQRKLSHRIARQFLKLGQGLVRFHWLYLSTQISYILGFAVGLMVLKKASN